MVGRGGGLSHLKVGGAEQLEAPPEHGVVPGLTGVAGDGLALAGSVHCHGEVEFFGGPANKSGTELGVEPGGDRLGQCPAEYRQAAARHGGEDGLRGTHVVRVAGDPALVEGEQQLGAGRLALDECRQLLQGDLGEMPVGVAVQLDRGDAEGPGRGLELFGAQFPEWARLAPARRPLRG